MKITITKTFECDDAIAYAILKLNQKGYKTEYCCSGHPGDNNPYILFDRWTSIVLDNFTEIIHPNNWNVDRDRHSRYKYKSLSIRRRFTEKEMIEFTDEELIDKAMKELDEWVDKLPYRPEPYVDYIYELDGEIWENPPIQIVDTPISSFKEGE